MRMTLASFFLALALLVAAIALPKRAEQPMQELVLDAAGAATLQVEGDANVDVEIVARSGHAARVQWPSDGDVEVTASRDGDTLRLQVTGKEDGHLQVRVPDGVRRFEFHRGTVHTGERLGAVEVRARVAASWSGAAESLDLVVTGDGSCGGDRYCDTSVNIGGEIGDLRVEARGGYVNLNRPDNFARATLRLGPGVGVNISDASRVDHLRIDRLDDDAPTATSDPANTPAVAH